MSAISGRLAGANREGERYIAFSVTALVAPLEPDRLSWKRIALATKS
jgi:hypothetical protein